MFVYNNLPLVTDKHHIHLPLVYTWPLSENNNLPLVTDKHHIHLPLVNTWPLSENNNLP
jgi:hypothetical protein